MAVICNWCDEEIHNGTGYSIKAVPFQPLQIGAQHTTEKKRIVSGIHLHEHPCRERFLGEAIRLADDHLPTLEETDPDQRETPKSDAEIEFERKQEQRKRERALKEERGRGWRDLDDEVKERLVLEALADSQLTNQAIRESIERKAALYPVAQALSGVTRRLHRAGRLEREEKEVDGRTRIYYKATELPAGLRELEKALGDGEAS